MKKLFLILTLFVLTISAKAQFTKPTGAVTIPTYSFFRNPADSSITIYQGAIPLYNTFVQHFDTVKLSGWVNNRKLLKYRLIGDSILKNGTASNYKLLHKIDSIMALVKYRNDTIVLSGYFTQFDALQKRNLNNHDSLQYLDEKQHASLTNVLGRGSYHVSQAARDSINSSRQMGDTVRNVGSATVYDVSLKQSTLTNPVTGTGTTNYVSKFTGISTLGNSLIYDNGTNVGIGTTGPTVKLDVSGVADAPSLTAARGIIRMSTNNITGLSIGGQLAAPYGTYIQSTNQPITSGGAYPLLLNPLGGNVGIGTINPTLGLLHVNGTGYFAGAVTSPNYVSNIATGTQPYATTSTTLNTNLNADLLDGQHGSYFEPAITAGTTAQYWRGDKTWQTLPVYTLAGLGGVALADSGKTSAGNYVTAKQLTEAVRSTPGKEASEFATIAALPAVVYANGSAGVGATLTGVAMGAIGIDSQSPAVGNRILVKNQVSTFQNGIYTVTATGSGIAVFVLTRALDFNQQTDILTGAATYVVGGTTLAGTTWDVNSADSPVIGTNAITFIQSAGPGQMVAGNGITITGTSIAINTAVTADLSTAQAMTGKTIDGVTPTVMSYVDPTSSIQTQLNSKQAALTNPITGTGTANYVSKFTGTGTLGNSLIYDNGTNVGIGTTGPGTKLSVLGTSNVPSLTSSQGIFRMAGTGNVGLEMGTINAIPYPVWIQTTNEPNTSGGAFPLALNPLSGNVGIGTVSPGSYKLYVNGTGYFAGAVTSPNYVSNIAIGTQPYATTSTTVNTNLNADLLDGQHGSYYEPAITAGTTSQYWRGDKTWQTLPTTASATTAAVTFNNSGTGDATGTTFNGSTAKTISWNSIGAQVAGTYSTGGGTATGTNTGDNAVNSNYSGLVTNATHSGDATGSTALTLATVNSNVGTYQGLTVNAKGLVTGASNQSYLTALHTIGVLTGQVWGYDSHPTTHATYGITDTPWTGMGYLTGTVSHAHGNITYAGAIGSTTGLPIITTTSGVLTVGSFSTTSGTFMQGNDSRANNGQTAYGWGNHASAGYLTAVPDLYLRNDGNDTSTGSVTATNFILSSDKRLKFNIQSLTNKDFDRIAKIDFRKFYTHKDSTELRFGVVADEVLKYAPEFVIVPKDPNEMKTVKYIDLLCAKIAELEARIKKLEKQNP